MLPSTHDDIIQFSLPKMKKANVGQTAIAAATAAAAATATTTTREKTQRCTLHDEEWIFTAIAFYTSHYDNLIMVFTNIMLFAKSLLGEAQLRCVYRHTAFA